ncbi:hypothetical protein [Asticcacaulis taihuensis]|uniref:Uncharacterized protein n=1 Tax=Asticcacaulis taihuensis TaxID=260084 RepID=A0A1G4PVH1_9CAUL|nr:hypothetical protein [Asticcacaulis taihuensis]SCW36227.1 hypothetical protein SAMN02927928_0692 [Asticcacaulis taihuensis]
MSTFADIGLRAPPHAIYETRDRVAFAPDSVLIFGHFETRSHLPESWVSQLSQQRIFQVAEGSDFGQIRIEGEIDEDLSLRENSKFRGWLNNLPATTVYLDITGLGHHLWMPILRMLLEGGKVVQCLYTEPGEYTYSSNPRPGDFYDLSEKMRGFRPIPTFARIPSRGRPAGLLIPLLGFEGVRFKHLVEVIEPNDKDIYPIIGVPGFEIDYPFHTFEGNADPLRSTRAWQRVDYVDASCPFSLFSLIERMRQDHPGRAIQVATIGTKPHALGAMLYAMRDDTCEILYDHPVRKQGRTHGSGKCHVYDISTFWRTGH